MIKSQVAFDFLSIQLASPHQIQRWGTYTRTNGFRFGQILTNKLIITDTLKPAPFGLFCEKIFGPIANGKCFCGRYLANYTLPKFCENCFVEFISPEMRRYRMGYIKLQTPVIHSWYLYGNPSYISLLLNFKLSALLELTYFTKYYFISKTRPVGINSLKKLQDYDFLNGANLIKYLLKNLNLESEVFYCRLLLHLYNFNYSNNCYYILKLHKIESQKTLLKRIRLLENFIATKSNPSWMILDILPVLPPLLRPLQKDVHGTIILSDLSKLYLQIFNANNQVIKNIQLGNSLRFINNSQRFLQETVDSLLDNEKQKVNLTSKAKTPLKSLSHLLGGKKGRFRENLLGKRVDFSGRSVIVVGPSLTLTQCGLPYKMAIELFKPFILRQLLRLKISLTLEKSKQIFHTEKLFILNLLKIIISKHFILLNRAPTLHRLGIQAFEPILIDGYAIQLHPLVCSSLNADFDGDQVAIHIPLTFNAQIEAKTLISTPNNIISVKNGEPIIMPSQDMVIGFNYLTIALKTKNFKTFYFNNYTEIIQAYEYQQITLHSPIWIKHLKIKQQMYNEINLQFKNIKLNSSQYLLTTLGRLLINNIFFKNLII